MSGVVPLSYVEGLDRIRSGEAISRVTRNVWLPTPVAGEDLPRLGALLTVLPPGSVLSGVTAATLHGLWVPGSSAVDLTVRPVHAVPRRRGVRAHRRRLAPGDVVEVAGLPVTSRARTWWDLATDLSLPDLVAAGDSALQAGALPDELRAQVVATRGRRGTRRARRALDLLDRRSRSRPESHLRTALVIAGLPRPGVNEAVHDDHGGWLAEPDLSYPAARLAIEYDGASHADPARMRRDITRELDLHRAGWLVLRYAAAEVFGRPEICARDVLTTLRSRAPALLAAGTRGRGPEDSHG